MIINFYRLYGTIFYTIDNHKKDTVYFSNTSEDFNRKFDCGEYIPTETRLTDKEAREWFKEHYPDCEIHKVDKHYHTEHHYKEDRIGD